MTNDIEVKVKFGGMTARFSIVLANRIVAIVPMLGHAGFNAVHSRGGTTRSRARLAVK